MGTVHSEPITVNAEPITGWKLRGIPNGVVGEYTDFTCTMEQEAPGVAVVEMAERLNTRDKVLRMIQKCSSLGFHTVKVKRHGKWRVYKIERGG